MQVLDRKWLVNSEAVISVGDRSITTFRQCCTHICGLISLLMNYIKDNSLDGLLLKEKGIRHQSCRLSVTIENLLISNLHKAPSWFLQYFASFVLMLNLQHFCFHQEFNGAVV